MQYSTLNSQPSTLNPQPSALFSSIDPAVSRLKNALNPQPSTLISLGLLLLFVGGMLYVLFRPQQLLLFHVADAMGLSPVIGQWRQTAAAAGDMQSPLAEFIVYNLPAGLWAASYVLITATLSRPLPPPRQYAAVAFIPLLGAASELLQAIHILPGTFDPVDLALYLLPLVAYEISFSRSASIRFETQSTNNN